MGSADLAWPVASLLARLRSAARAAMLDAGSHAVFHQGQPLLRQGEDGDFALLLLTGCVKVIASIEDGKEAILAVRMGGDLVGEMACLNDKPRSATVVAGGPVEARSIPRSGLLALMNDHPDVAIEISRITSERLRWANERRVDLVARSAPVRVCRLIVHMSLEYGHSTGSGWTLDFALTQGELASLAGVALRTVEKTLRMLNRDKIIRSRYRNIEIIDMKRLRSVAEMTFENPH